MSTTSEPNDPSGASAQENPNTNCLAGWRCPKCGYRHSFDVQVTTWVTVTDDGSDFSKLNGEREYDDRSAATCNACGHEGVVSEFRASDAEDDSDG